MTILLDLKFWQQVRAVNEIFCYAFLLVCILITFVKLYGMQKVSFLRILLTLMLFNCFQGIYAGAYWWDYAPGPFPDADPTKVDMWLVSLSVSDFIHDVSVDLTMWLVSWKFYSSAS